ncbi:MAG TPA: thioesterase family protein [Candidatus Limnocylindrales bacterium]|nr:thioesterase family protein [Candidatus Limnocylindrales bacterium]
MVIDETLIRVRYKDTDQMGVVYHANYLVWFEIGRTELMRRLGMLYRELEKSNLFLPVLKAYCEYKIPARYDDQLTVLTRIESLQSVRLTFAYEIRREGKLLAKGYTEHAFINEVGRPVVLRKLSPFLWNRLTKALEGQAL